MKFTTRRVALHALPVILVLGAMAPFVQHRVVAYLVVATVALCSWLLGAVMGLNAPAERTDP